MNLDVVRLCLAITYANARRESRDREVDGTRSSSHEPDPAERVIDELFAASDKLVVYGTLLPAERNHGELSDLGGTWRECHVHGTLHPTGWGAAIGFPAIRLDPTAPRVPAMLFESPALRDRWARLDRFEGDEYRRVLAPAYDGRELIAVANIYEAREITGR